MPTYQYECDACHYTFDILQSMLDKKMKKCPECGKNKLHRLIGAGSGIIFKGSGFYETDYKRKDGVSAKGTSPSKEKPADKSKSKDDHTASGSGKKAKQKKNQAV